MKQKTERTNEETQARRRLTARVSGAELRARAAQFRRSRQRSALGAEEVVGLSVAALLLVITLFAYFMVLRPGYERQTALQKERESLRRELKNLDDDNIKVTDERSTAASLTDSVAAFEGAYLPYEQVGKIGLYRSLNELMLRNGVRNTSGPNYAPLGALNVAGRGVGGATDVRGNDRWQTIYPGLYINVTVEGGYPNLRRFVRDIEADSQFIVINAVELEGGDNDESRARAGIVSLRLEMSAYFQRAAASVN